MFKVLRPCAMKRASREEARAVTAWQGSVGCLAGTTPRRCRDGFCLLGYGRSPNRRAHRQRDILDTCLLIEGDHRASDFLSNRLTRGTGLYQTPDGSEILRRPDCALITGC